VQGDDPTAHEFPAYAVEAGPSECGREIGRPRESPHARRQVRVGPSAGKELARKRDGPVEPEPEERLEHALRPRDLEAGDASSLSNFKSAIIIERPNVYTLYEQNIGLLTPIVAEKLQEAEGHYPVEWINAAFEEAVLNNKRNWRYIERILERWTVEGRQSGKDRGSVEQSLDLDKYTKGKYAFLFKPDEK